MYPVTPPSIHHLLDGMDERAALTRLENIFAARSRQRRTRRNPVSSGR